MNTNTAASNTTLNILIIEDESLIAFDIQGLLQDWGYGVSGIASDGATALEIFKAEKPDLVLVDINLLGEMDGIETVKAMNSIHPVPIIYLTAQSDFTTVNRAKATNPAAFLLKPFDERSLSISIDLALNNFHNKKCKKLSEEGKTESEPLWANEVKLTSDIILKKNNQIFIKQNYRFVSFCEESLLYIEADSNHSYIVTEAQKFIVRMSLSGILERLDLPFIVRIHRSYAININYVKQFDENEISLGDKDFPITASYKEDFFRHFKVL